MRHSWASGAAIALLAALSPLGCATGPTPAELRGAEYTVRKVEFEGARRFSDRDIYEHLELRPIKWLPLPRRYWYYPGLVPLDSLRVVELYNAYGYYDARVEDVEVEQIDRRCRDRVDIHYTIEEGEVTTVDSLIVRWPEGPPSGPPRAVRAGPFVELPSTDPERLSRRVTLELGGPFEVPELLASAAALRVALRELGHPFVVVDPHAEVDRAARLADVEFEVRPGPFMRIGEISLVGLDTVPRDAILRDLAGLRGEPYSPGRIAQIEQRVYAIGMFSTVVVEPEPTDLDDDGELDITVRVRETDPQRVRLGVALGFEPNRWEQRFEARYEHRNLFRDLYKLRLTGRLGYAELPSLVRPIAHGPVGVVNLRVEKQGLIEAGLVWTVEPSVELGVEQGYQFWSLRHRFGVSRFFTRWFQAELSHNLRYVDFFNSSPALTGGDTQLGLDYRDPYILSYIAIAATVWAVDAMAQPNDGVVIEAEYRVAGGPFGGDFDYQEIVPGLRGYWRPRHRLQLATRAEVGLIFPFGDSPGAPIDMRRYLGGNASVRGWGRRRLAPRTLDCSSGACESIPVGGNTSVLGSFELRVLTWEPLWLAAFLDVGDVQPGVGQFEPRQWNYSAGGGVRLETPVGKFRLDLGVRLNETELGASEPRWAIHFGLGESF